MSRPQLRVVDCDRTLHRAVALSLFALAAIVVYPASANLSISSIIDSSITSDPNSAAIQGVINSAITFYQNRFADPITVSIKFQKDTSISLGRSQFDLYSLSYSTFYSAINADKTTSDDNSAMAHLPAGPNNPVTSNGFMLAKAANLNALGISHTPPSLGFDGIISLNTNATDVSGGQYHLLAVVEHEIDEVLGLGSTLGLGLGTPHDSEPSPEDLFRYNSAHARSFTTSGDDAWFSFDGTNNLVQFNQHSPGDYGDWWSNNGGGNPGPVPPPRVQDAFAYPLTTPELNDASVELQALDVIGYNRIAVPELAAPIGLLVVFAACFIGSKLSKRAKNQKGSLH